jgi:uncharacterized membrane protein
MQYRPDLYSIGITSILLLLILLFMTPVVHARDYSLENGTANITVQSNGLVHVEESITYTFIGTYNEVFRRVYSPPDGSIKNIQGYCEGKTCDFQIAAIPGGFELIGKLPKPTPETITFVVSYDYYRGLKVYDDVSELHYKMWGDEWEKPLNRLTVDITLPVQDGDTVRYWLHPDTVTKQSTLNGNVITISTNTIPSREYYEIRAVFPRIDSPDPNYVSLQKGDGLDKILAIEKKYETKKAIANIIYYFSILLAAIVVLFPIFIYLKYGREPNIDYFSLYEREPPSNSKPAVVNAIMMGKIGIPTLDGFVATVMDLVYHDYIRLHDTKTEKKYFGLINHEVEDVIIEIKEDTDVSDLQDFEMDVYSLLKRYTADGQILWSEMKEELGKDTKFYDFINRWNKKVKNQIKIDRLFISKGNTYLIAFSSVVFLTVIFGLIIITNFFPSNQFPIISSVIVLGVFSGILTFILIFFTVANEKGLGRWTPEGRLLAKRWDNFKKYLVDFSALEEHPPESIKIWDHYMVYAVSLGVARKALKNMSLIVPSDQFATSHFHGVYYNSGFISGFSSAYSSSSPKSSSSGGGVGGVGGGFGGGGGGAR